MILCTIQTEQICAICLEKIKPGSEALRFYHRGKIKFRHLDCQYELRKRKVSLEEWTEEARYQTNMSKINRVREEGLKLRDMTKIEKYIGLKRAEDLRHKDILNKLTNLRQLLDGT